MVGLFPSGDVGAIVEFDGSSSVEFDDAVEFADVVFDVVVVGGGGNDGDGDGVTDDDDDDSTLLLLLFC